MDTQGNDHLLVTKGFTAKHNLKIHSLGNTEDRPFACNQREKIYCEAIFDKALSFTLKQMTICFALIVTKDFALIRT